MSRNKIQIIINQKVKSKLKILAELQGKTFQEFMEIMLTEMVEDIDINVKKSEPNKGDQENEQEK